MVGLYILAIFTFLFVNLSVCTDPTDPFQTLPATASPGCIHNGQTYKPHTAFNPSPCEHCMCSGTGQVACAIADCFFTPCVDAIHDPKKCCPVCPNGPNCKAPDGTIIKRNETHQPDKQTTCSCPQRFGFGSPLALCAVMPPQVTLIDPVVS